MARTCNQPGCTGATSARGMCRQHYRAWLVTVPQMKMDPRTRKLMLDALPGTQGQLVERTGLAPQTVKRAIARFRADQEIHISRFKRPNKNGEKFAAVFKLGPGKDAEVSAKVRASHHRKNARAAYRRRCDATLVMQAQRATVKAFSWAAPLMMGL